MTDRELMQQALDALVRMHSYGDVFRYQNWQANPYEQVSDAVTPLRERLAQPEQEPVAWLRVIDEAMVTHHLGVADPADDYETAKRKMNNLLCTAQDIGTFFAKTEPVQEPAADGLPLVVAGAIFDFAGYLTTRESVIDVGATANASPVADLVKAWANLRGLPLNDAAVLSWQEWLHTAPPQRKPLTEEEIGLLTTDPRFAHIETPTLAEFARAVIAKATGGKE